MRCLLAVVNSHNRPAFQQAIRDTWLPFIPVGTDYKFFLGPSEREPKADEVFLNCDDSYQGLPSKVRAIVRWAYEHGYDFVLKCDDDVILKPARVMSSGFMYHDFTGHANDKRTYPVPFGFCYWLSRKSMAAVVDAELPKDNNDEVWVTECLSRAGIVLSHDPRYAMYTGKRESYVPKAPRALRAPVRPRWEDPSMVLDSDVIAWCMFINWTGYGNTPQERVVQEMHSVFERSR
ncbi:MAG: hypothetical protein ABSD89_14830 [Halobacteriota archaeon]